MAAAPPYVSYSSCTIARVPTDRWNFVYGSLQALKAHVQEYPGCISFDLFARVEEEQVVVHAYTTWDTAEQLDAYLERGYSLLRYLGEVEGIRPSDHLVMEKIF
jgi:antibiotic biosynthesis monooxygenase